jgi:hypothetical protein
MTCCSPMKVTLHLQPRMLVQLPASQLQHVRICLPPIVVEPVTYNGEPVTHNGDPVYLIVPRG